MKYFYQFIHRIKTIGLCCLMAPALLFAGPPGLCNEGQHYYYNFHYVQDPGSEVIVQNMSIFEMDAGSRYIIDNAVLRIKEGSHFIMNPCAELVITNGGQLIIESGANICLNDEAIIVYESLSNLVFQNGFLIGNNDCVSFESATEFEIVFGSMPATIITQNTEWSAKKYKFNSNIIVEYGASLTLSNQTSLLFNSTSGIIVKRGAELIVDNSTLSNLCKSERWQGVQVYGNYKKSQHAVDENGRSYQGKISVINGSMIENAGIGILAGALSEPLIDKDYTQIPVTGVDYNGGIVIVRNSAFVDNRIAISLQPYENKSQHHQGVLNNMSSVINSNFEYNNPQSGKANNPMFIVLNTVRGIALTGNKYLYSYHTHMPSFNIIGISSLNSSFKVENYCIDNSVHPCQDYKLSRFENLTFGIRALGTGSEKTFTVDSALFIDNFTGIYTSMIDNFTVIRSKFEIRNLHEPADDAIHGGLYVHNEAIGFIIEENLFTGPSEIPDNLTVGVAFNNTGEHANELYNNTFQNLNYGVVAMHINRSEDGRAGLCLKCNDFSLNNYDIATTYDDQLYTWGGIAPNQGGPGPTPDAPAGNRFSHAGDEDNPTDIVNLGWPITYYLHRCNSCAKS
jgi:hypothetical protein